MHLSKTLWLYRYIYINFIDFPMTLRNLTLSPSPGGSTRRTSRAPRVSLLLAVIISFHSFPSISFHFSSCHFLSFPFTSFHFLSFSFLSFHIHSCLYFPFSSFHFISFPFISFPFIYFHFLSFLFISFHFLMLRVRAQQQSLCSK